MLCEHFGVILIREKTQSQHAERPIWISIKHVHEGEAQREQRGADGNARRGRAHRGRGHPHRHRAARARAARPRRALSAHANGTSFGGGRHASCAGADQGTAGALVLREHDAVPKLHHVGHLV